MRSYLNTRGCRIGVALTTFIFWLVVVPSTDAAAAGTDGAELVQQRRCYGCHQLTETLLGPSYQAISMRHRGRSEVMVEVLANKIIVGGSGNWGIVPMVPNEHVSLEEARVMARWILNLESDKP